MKFIGGATEAIQVEGEIPEAIQVVDAIPALNLINNSNKKKDISLESKDRLHEFKKAIINKFLETEPMTLKKRLFEELQNYTRKKREPIETETQLMPIKEQLRYFIDTIDFLTSLQIKYVHDLLEYYDNTSTMVGKASFSLASGPKPIEFSRTQITNLIQSVYNFQRTPDTSIIFNRRLRRMLKTIDSNFEKNKQFQESKSSESDEPIDDELINALDSAKSNEDKKKAALAVLNALGFDLSIKGGSSFEEQNTHLTELKNAIIEIGRKINSGLVIPEEYNKFIQNIIEINDIRKKFKTKKLESPQRESPQKINITRQMNGFDKGLQLPAPRSSDASSGPSASPSAGPLENGFNINILHETNAQTTKVLQSQSVLSASKSFETEIKKPTIDGLNRVSQLVINASETLRDRLSTLKRSRQSIQSGGSISGSQTHEDNIKLAEKAIQNSLQYAEFAEKEIEITIKAKHLSDAHIYMTLANFYIEQEEFSKIESLQNPLQDSKKPNSLEEAEQTVKRAIKISTEAKIKIPLELEKIIPSLIQSQPDMQIKDSIRSRFGFFTSTQSLKSSSVAKNEANAVKRANEQVVRRQLNAASSKPSRWKSWFSRNSRKPENSKDKEYNARMKARQRAREEVAAIESAKRAAKASSNAAAKNAAIIKASQQAIKDKKKEDDELREAASKSAATAAAANLNRFKEAQIKTPESIKTSETQPFIPSQQPETRVTSSPLNRQFQSTIDPNTPNESKLSVSVNGKLSKTQKSKSRNNSEIGLKKYNLTQSMGKSKNNWYTHPPQIANPPNLNNLPQAIKNRSDALTRARKRMFDRSNNNLGKSPS